MQQRKKTRHYLTMMFVFSTLGVMGQSDENLRTLEQRLVKIEARLTALEKKSFQETSGNRNSADINPTAMGILTKSAWRDLRWTEQKQWESLRNGMSTQEVVELLGRPPRSVKTLKPKIDLVYFYETSLLDASSKINGKVSFKNGIVVDFLIPNFQTVQDHRKTP